MNKFFKWGILLLYVIVTFIRILNHQTWHDEARAWLIAEYLNIFEIFDLMKVEGHTFVWYVLLMPFAKTHFEYPYSMLILNCLFCIGSIFVLWKYSPFNMLTKILITFSSPFFVWYAILARCYAVGIFLLFILTALFKNKSKIPIIYSVLILLAANTSVMAIAGAFAFAVLFLSELFKNKQYKDLIISLSIGLICVILLFLQLFGANPTLTGMENMFDGLSFKFFSNVFVFPHAINLILLIILSGLSLFCIIKSKVSSFFLFITYLFLLCIFHFVYLGYSWHHYFFFVYFIISVWLYLQEEKISLKFKNIFSIALILISFFYCFDYRDNRGVFNSGSKILANKIIELGKDSSIIFVYRNFFQILPYIEKENIDYYYSYKVEKVLNPIKEEKYIPKHIYPEVISEIYKKKPKTYVFILNKEYPLTSFVIPASDGNYELNLQEVFGKNVYIFKVNKL